ncbi:MAG: 50S ribosomal protein L24 [Cytophagales bacterium]|nr:50S ribosomal protein L24 [Cytophagales bacterium]MDW8385239.1 50S ribosomal protein L24 [Flammeovirgaceae bacterium]
MKKKLVKHKFHIKTGDRVMVIAGNHKGKEGVVKQVLREKERAIVEGVNLVTKHIKPTQSNPEGKIVKVEAGIHISNLMLIDPATGKPTRIGRRRDANGKLKRYSKKTQQFID